MSNDRLKEIDEMVNKLKLDDNISKLIDKYKYDLDCYDYIDNVDTFSTLRMRGTIKYINKYDQKLRVGGLLVKIYNKNNNWYCVLLQPDKKYHVSFNSNYIFYLGNKDENIRKWAEYFISNIDNNI